MENTAYFSLSFAVFDREMLFVCQTCYFMVLPSRRLINKLDFQIHRLREIIGQ